MNPARVAELAGDLPIRVVAQTSSTNDDARALALAGAPHGAAVVADHQTSGRGRLGRRWTSPPGANVMLSVVLRDHLDPARLGRVSLAAAVAVVEVVGAAWRIKWPNDVVSDHDGRKLAGILAEAEWARGVPAFVVVGVGVNVHARPPDLPAVALAEVGPAPERERLAVELVRSILRWSARDDVLDAWRARSATLGRRVRIGEIEGVAVDLADDGALIVRGDDGAPQVVRTGDVAMVGGW